MGTIIDPLVIYPFDSTGRAASNLVPGEGHAVNTVNFRDYYFVVPTYAPFFAEGLSLTLTLEDGSSRPLVEGQDYALALPFVAAIRSIGVPIYGALTLNNTIVTGTVSVTYQTLGGDYTTDPNAILERLATMIYNPRTTLWDVVTNKPQLFPPINHAQNFGDYYSEQQLVDALASLADTIATHGGTTINITPATTPPPTPTTGDSNVYTVTSNVNEIASTDSVHFYVRGTGVDLPPILYWSLIGWSGTSLNFSATNGAVAVSSYGADIQGSFIIQGTNANATPVSFVVELRKGSISGPIVAYSEMVSITNHDIDSGIRNPADGVLTAVVNGKTVMRLDDPTNTRTWYFGPNNAYRMVLQADGNVVIFDALNNAVFTSAGTATTAYVQTALAALVSSSPATLDTLRELASALGNDPNFATTVMAAISSKQAGSVVLSALAGVTLTADKLIYASGNNLVATTALTAFARQLLAAATDVTVRTLLGLGTAATLNVGTGAGTVAAGDHGHASMLTLANVGTTANTVAAGDHLHTGLFKKVHTETADITYNTWTFFDYTLVFGKVYLIKIGWGVQFSYYAGAVLTAGNDGLNNPQGGVNIVMMNGAGSYGEYCGFVIGCTAINGAANKSKPGFYWQNAAGWSNGTTVAPATVEIYEMVP